MLLHLGPGLWSRLRQENGQVAAAVPEEPAGVGRNKVVAVLFLPCLCRQVVGFGKEEEAATKSLLSENKVAQFK